MGAPIIPVSWKQLDPLLQLYLHYDKDIYNRIGLKNECPVNALRAQNLACGHILGHEIRLVLVSLSI